MSFSSSHYNKIHFQSERSGDDTDEDDVPLRKGKKGKNHLLLSKKKSKKSNSNDDDGPGGVGGAKKKLSMLFGRRRYVKIFLQGDPSGCSLGLLGFRFIY